MNASIIIPYYNNEYDLEECLLSALDQGDCIKEIILIDNNSVDNSSLIAQKYKSCYPHKIILASESIQNASAARNKGLSLATGEWIQFLDADDTLLPNKVHTQLTLGRRLNKDLVIGSYLYNFNDGNRLFKHYPTFDNIWLALFQSRLGNTCCNLWIKSKLQEVHGWNQNLESSQEYDLLFRLLKIETQVCFDQQLNTIINRRSNSISTGNRQRENWITFVQQKIEIYNYILKHFPSNFNANKDVYITTLVNYLSHLALYDLPLAEAIHSEFIAKNFYLTSSENGKVFKFLYNLLGFDKGIELYKCYLKVLKLIGRYPY